MLGLETFVDSKYPFLNTNKKNFGAKKLNWLFQDNFNPRNVKAILFELIDDRFPDGSIMGKCILWEKVYDPLRHPALQEISFLQFLTSSDFAKGSEQISCLPQIIARFPFVSVYSLSLTGLPLPYFNETCYPTCSVILSKRYDYTLETMALRYPDLNSSQWKQVVFQIIHGLFVLQKRIKFHHNDLHSDNILIEMESEPKSKVFSLELKQKRKNRKIDFAFPPSHFNAVIWDYETCLCFDKTVPLNLQTDYGLCGPKYCTPDTFCPAFDTHLFMVQFLNIENIPEEIKEFIRTLYPSELLPDFANFRKLHEDTDTVSQTSSQSWQSVTSVNSTESIESRSSCIYEDDTVSTATPPLSTLIQQLLTHPDIDLAICSALKEDLASWCQNVTGVSLLPITKSDDASSLELSETSETEEIENSSEEAIDDESKTESTSRETTEPDTYDYDARYSKNATHFDYIAYWLDEEEKTEVKELVDQEPDFYPPDDQELLAYFRLCRRGWCNRNLPTPQDILLHDFFSEFRV